MVDTPECCPLCGAAGAAPFCRDRRREYLRCPHCQLVFTPRQYHLSSAEERAHYDLHTNHPGDEGYRRFLGRLFVPLNECLSPASRGLDFGSGPGPTLSLMFAEAGHPTAIYDPYYAPDADALRQCYDFITATEVVEHLARPGLELARLWELVKPGGWLGLMTKQVLDAASFANWHYKNDPTHIVFFSRQTFLWLGERWGAEPTFIGSDVILFHKP